MVDRCSLPTNLQTPGAVSMDYAGIAAARIVGCFDAAGEREKRHTLSSRRALMLEK
jgi:hypothetical protein